MRTKPELESKLATSIDLRDKALEARRWGGMPYVNECIRGEVLSGWIYLLEDAICLHPELPDEPKEDDPPTYSNQGELEAWAWLTQREGVTV